MSDKHWELIFNEKSYKKFKRLPKDIQKRINSYFKDRVLSSIDPTVYAKELVGDLRGLWRFRVGDYRIIAVIHMNEMVIVSIDVAHRKEIYNIH
jgi:mRNA interferase RelE/StbE